jgi:crossover junction endodeoxyribonuclease RuvC
VAIAAALSRDLSYTEYEPAAVKQRVTGNGNAAKEQVSDMLCRMYPISQQIEFLDATDALAVAVCHHLQQKVVFGKTKAPNWKSFIAQNADRVL